MKPAWAVAAIMIVLAGVCRAQLAEQYGKGFLPSGSYDYSQVGTVNVENGNLILNIPLLSYKQRGSLPNLTIDVILNSWTWQTVTIEQPDGSQYYQWVPLSPVQLADFGPVAWSLSGMNYAVGDMYTGSTYSVPAPAPYSDSYISYPIIYDRYDTPHMVGSTVGHSETIDGTGLGGGDGGGVLNKEGISYAPEYCSASSNGFCIQKGISGDTPRVRSFVYDGLSRLVSATNPESGAVSYTYDANGNLSTKVSPAVNAASGTQAIGYCYDALNRMTYKFYSGSFNFTAPTGFGDSYSYDASSVPGAQNAVGRLTDEKSYAGNTLVSERQPYAYDAAGRLLNENQYTLAGLTKSQPYPVAFRYDLAGDITASTDGITPAQTAYTSAPCTGSPGAWATLTFIRCYDTGGHLFSLSANWSDSTHPVWLAVAPQYEAFGGPLAVGIGVTSTLSSITALTAWGYDNRLRLTSKAGYVAPAATGGSATVTITGAEQTQ